MTSASVPVARAADGPDDAEEVMKSLQGKWKLVALTVDGLELGKENYGKSVLIHDGKTQTIQINGEDRGSFDVEVRPGAEPSEIDLSSINGPSEGRKYPGIYKLEGDRLTVCTSRDPDRRPTEFASESGTRITLAVYERQEP
jgi:uncharacterized protein (TIGR03067 family)